MCFKSWSHSYLGWSGVNLGNCSGEWWLNSWGVTMRHVKWRKGTRKPKWTLKIKFLCLRYAQGLFKSSDLYHLYFTWASTFTVLKSEEDCITWLFALTRPLFQTAQLVQPALTRQKVPGVTLLLPDCGKACRCEEEWGYWGWVEGRVWYSLPWLFTSLYWGASIF